MRWKGLIFILILAIGIFLLVGIFTDNWLEGKIEHTASGINGAKVEIDNLDCSIFKLSLAWDRMQITDSENTMKNIIETGSCELNLGFLPLLYRDIVIDKFQISGFQTGTKRETDGKLPRKKKATEKKEPGLIATTTSKLYGQLKNYSGLRFQNVKSKLNPDSLLAALNLQSIQYIDSLRKTYTQRYEYWEEQINSDDIREELQNLEKDYKKIKAIDPESIKSVDELKEVALTLRKARKNLLKVRDRVENLGDNFQKDVKRIEVTSSEIQTVVQRDYKKIKKKAKIPDLDRQNLANFIFGEEVVTRVGFYLGIVNRIRDYYEKIAEFKKSEEKKQKPERFEGQDIQYSGRYNYPKFWIKEIELSGITNDSTKLGGLVKNIVSNQNKINAPTEIKLEGKRKDGGQITFSATLDNRTPQARDQFRLNVKNISLDNITISKSQIFPYKIARGKGQMDAEIKLASQEFEGGLDFQSRSLQFARTSQKGADTKAAAIINDLVSDLDRLNLNVAVTGSEGTTDFQLSSNIDDVFNRKIKSIISEEVAAARQELENKVDQKVSRARDEFNKVITAKRSELEKEIKKYGAELKKYEDQIEAKQKQVEDRIKKMGGEQIDKIKDKAQDNLDSLKQKGKDKLDDLF